MRRELVDAPERPDASGAVETDDAASAGKPVPAVVAAETEDEFERALTAAFGPVERWWIGPDGLPLPLP